MSNTLRARIETFFDDVIPFAPTHISTIDAYNHTSAQELKLSKRTVERYLADHAKEYDVSCINPNKKPLMWQRERRKSDKMDSSEAFAWKLIEELKEFIPPNISKDLEYKIKLANDVLDKLDRNKPNNQLFRWRRNCPLRKSLKQNVTSKGHIHSVIEAINEAQNIDISYRENNQKFETHISVTPMELYLFNDSWNLLACNINDKSKKIEINLSSLKEVVIAEDSLFNKYPSFNTNRQGRF